MRKLMGTFALGMLLLAGPRAKGDDCYWWAQALANHEMQLGWTNGDLAFAQQQVSFAIAAGAQPGEPYLNYLVSECVRLEGLAGYWQGQIDDTKSSMQAAHCY